MRDTRLPVSLCPRCGRKLDAATHVENASPDELDFSICLGCQEVLRFYRDDEDELKLRSLTEEDIQELPLVELARLQKLLKRYKDQRQRRSQARARRKKKRKQRSR